jgi:hypothetical protein
VLNYLAGLSACESPIQAVRGLNRRFTGHLWASTNKTLSAIPHPLNLALSPIPLVSLSLKGGHLLISLPEGQLRS